MATHAELVNELPLLERMGTAERMRLAKKRRSQQLRKYLQLEQKQRDLELKERQQQEEEDENPKIDLFSQNMTFGKFTTSCDEDEKKKKKKKKKKDRKISFIPNVILLEAGSRNDIAEVTRLLDSGVSPDLRNDDGLSVLHQCCIENFKDLLVALLDRGANPDVKDNESWTPLHTAATCGRVDLCGILIERGADLLEVNADGNMPYDICQDQDTLDYIEKRMSEKGITQEAVNERRNLKEQNFLSDLKLAYEDNPHFEYIGPKNETYLHVAAANGYTEVALFLLDKGCEVDSTDDDLWQPIHCAACWDQPQMLELLVEHGADLEARTKNNETPLDICEDMELKQRILQLQKDRLLKDKKMKSSSKGSSHPPSRGMQGRRGSITNTRSASVRRSSTSQKKSMALKEAKEEAMRMKMEKKIDGAIKGEKMKAKPGSKFKLKTITARNSSKKFAEDGDDTEKTTSSQYQSNANDKSSVRYRKCESSTGEFSKFVKNSPLKNSQHKDEENKNCCRIV